jgi:hypothetical protein
LKLLTAAFVAGSESGVAFWNALAGALPADENNAAAPHPPPSHASHAEQLALSQLMVLLHTYQLAEAQAATLGGVCGLGLAFACCNAILLSRLARVPALSQLFAADVSSHKRADRCVLGCSSCSAAGRCPG